ncbi:G-type lectin S-receptor-like serine/threonine-protein kinase RKS1 [Mercurialis annua]|uniref:G-type lectin S-receptor-like serine/threonine-protein kinase RKS1 n=1 Tax=Mercurialis annua TaxID=3986 RepID=UPI00215E9D5A|nr:G-type lectin S-receptor-like serine/threonine-protein kinase RKS1 [Mercurialis annua]
MMSRKHRVEYVQTVLLIIIHFTVCTSFDTITVNQTIIDGNLVISKHNNFALGFFSPGNSNLRYVGIWYYKVGQKTVVWVANRNHGIHGSSGILSINRKGNLVLYDREVIVWSTGNLCQNCVAQLLDSGNLVVTTKNVSFWQSFDYPTDTLLPGMKLGFNRNTGLHRVLKSWKSADDPAIGEYSLEVDPSGLPQIFMYKGRNPIWRAIPVPLKTYVDVRNYSFVNNEEEIAFSFFILDDSVILRIVLDYSGDHKHVTWHETEKKWKEIWSAPKYQCESYRRCGINSKCEAKVVNRVFECDCLPGFEPKNPRDWYILRDGSGGCVRKPQEPFCTDGEGFVKLERVKVPDTRAAAWVNMSTSTRKDCEEECRKSCSCAAFASIYIIDKGSGCFLWFGELIDTVGNSGRGVDLYVRVDAHELASSKKSKRIFGMESMVFILVLSVFSAWFMLFLIAYLLVKRNRTRVRGRWKQRFVRTFRQTGDGRRPLDIAFYNLTTILAATNCFSPTNKLGEGGFGSVFKGKLANGQEIAVKRLGENSGQGIEEFKNEIMLIAKLQHKNLVKLLGCCIEGDEVMLIYEYLSNKSLDFLLFDEVRRSDLNWRKRFSIIVGIARGILYLHQDSRVRIIHRDLKTSNILLDEEMNPKISDFGMARISQSELIQEKTTKIVGTFGYMPPEYVVFGRYSTKSDVYSYGVILLEIISGKKNNNFCKENTSLTLIEHVWELWKENKVSEIVDPLLDETYDCDKALRYIQTGMLCVQRDETDRPTMFDVVLMLNSDIYIPAPKEPAFVARNHLCNNSKVLMGEEISCSINEMTITVMVSR